ncbi:MAG: ExbD/TolR family protein [Myxococcota bacterium]
MRERRRDARLEFAAELDVIPVMSLIVHLIPMLLLSVRFLSLASVSGKGPVLPASPATSAAQLAEQDEKVISVLVDGGGFHVTGVAGTPAIPCRGACTPETYDYGGLTQAMVEAKRARPGESRVIIVPTGDVPYEVLVKVMDATRSRRTGNREETLFPLALLAAEGA